MKSGLIGIALACAIFCYVSHSEKVSRRPRVETSFTGGDKVVNVFELLRRTELVWSMQTLLWPEATGNLKHGPLDGYYLPLSQEQIDEMMEFIRLRRELLSYIPDGWDCDDFAREFGYLARVWLARKYPGLPVSPAVGAAYVHVEDCGPYELFSQPVWGVFNHAINVILRDDGQWFFVEPQTGKLQPIDGPIYEGTMEVVWVDI